MPPRSDSQPPDFADFVCGCETVYDPGNRPTYFLSYAGQCWLWRISGYYEVIGHLESDIHAFATLAPICDKERPGHSYQRGFSTDTDGDHAGLDDVGAGEAPPDASVEPSRVSRRELRGGRARK